MDFSPDYPAAPDPAKTAASQAALNKETATAQYGLNATNQRTPYGDLTYDQIGTWPDGTPRFQATQTLSPNQQQLLDTTQQAQQNIADIGRDQSSRIATLLNTPLDTSTLSDRGTLPHNAPEFRSTPQGPTYQPAPTQGQRISNVPLQGVGTEYAQDLRGTVTNVPLQGVDTTEGYEAGRQRVENAMYDRQRPQMEQDRANLETQLINKGISPGSEAWNNEMDRFQRGVNDARTAITLAGGQEQSRLAGLDLSRTGFNNDAWLAGSNFFNNAQAQDFNQARARQGDRLAATGFNNAALEAGANFFNRAQGEDLSQRMALTDMANNLGDKIFQNEVTRTNMDNAQAQQGFGNQLTLADAQNARRGSELAEATALRQMPINEIAALLSGSQVTAPSFQRTPTPGVAPTDIIGPTALAYQGQLKQADAAAANSRALMSGIFGLGSAALGGFGMGGGWQSMFGGGAKPNPYAVPGTSGLY